MLNHLNIPDEDILIFSVYVQNNAITILAYAGNILNQKSINYIQKVQVKHEN